MLPLLLLMGGSELGSPECCMHMLRCDLAAAQCACYSVKRCSLYTLPDAWARSIIVMSARCQFRHHALSVPVQAVSSPQCVLTAGARLCTVLASRELYRWQAHMAVSSPSEYASQTC